VIWALWQGIYAYVRAAFDGQPVTIDGWMLSWFAVAAALCALGTIIPLRVGLRRIEQLEF
jgi:hypothetical protein